MANTYTNLLYHVVFSTKERFPWIRPEIEQRVWEYLAATSQNNGLKAFQIGGIEDHLHIALAIPPTMAVSKAVQLLKGSSSKWVHDTFPKLGNVAWQDGYGAFSVSKSNLDSVVKYIAGQREHHRRRTFQDEYRALLRKHGVDFDERYIWG